MRQITRVRIILNNPPYQEVQFIMRGNQHEVLEAIERELENKNGLSISDNTEGIHIPRRGIMKITTEPM